MEAQTQTVQYCITSKDLDAAWKKAPGTKKFVFLTATGLFALGILPAILTHALTREAVVTSIVIAVAYFFLFRYGLRLFLKRELRTLTISSETISTQIGEKSGAIPWSKVAKVSSTADHVFIVGRNHNVFTIPVSAFEGKTERQRFIRSCEENIATARRK